MANFGMASGFGKFGGIFTGWSLKTDKEKQEQKFVEKQSILAIDPDDGSTLLDASHYVATGLNIDGTFQSQAALINEYRAMAMNADVDNAIDDVVNAVVVSDEDESTVDIDLEGVDVNDSIKEKVVEEFNHIIGLMNFNTLSYEKVKQWYVDGRLFYHVIVDEKNLKRGILRLTNLDPRAVRKIREVQKGIDPSTRIERIIRTDTYYMYDQTWAVAGVNSVGAPSNQMRDSSVVRPGQTIRMSEDSIAMTHSGWTNIDGNMILSFLEKARKPLNNLKMMEDALVVYRITRAPERRVFYIDVGSLPKKSAEEYLTSVMNKYKTKMVYDPVTGKVNGTAYQISMMEDYWLPRREGGRGTEIDTLQGGENLGSIDDIVYFQKKLFKSLNVPASRLEGEGQILIGGQGPEITRDEWKFDKFVRRLRKRFSMLFLDLLRKQLIMKNITTDEDWDELFVNKIKFKYRSDSYMQDAKEVDEFQGKINLLGTVTPYIGKYFSQDYVERKVLKWTDEEIAEQRKKIQEEIASGLYLDPRMQDAPEETSNFDNF